MFNQLVVTSGAKAHKTEVLWYRAQPQISWCSGGESYFRHNLLSKFLSQAPYLFCSTLVLREIPWNITSLTHQPLEIYLPLELDVPSILWNTGNTLQFVRALFLGEFGHWPHSLYERIRICLHWPSPKDCRPWPTVLLHWGEFFGILLLHLKFTKACEGQGWQQRGTDMLFLFANVGISDTRGALRRWPRSSDSKRLFQTPTVICSERATQ